MNQFALLLCGDVSKMNNYIAVKWTPGIVACEQKKVQTSLRIRAV